MNALTNAVERLLNVGAPGHHPASAIAGLWAGSLTQVAAGGWAQLPEPTTPGARMSPDTLLDLASVTKVASATTLIMLLYADGQLDLDAPVRRYLPKFRGDGKDDVTLEQLLSHTAGLQPWWPLYCETTDRDEALERTQTLPLATKPGTGWVYSDLGFILAGRIVERVTALGLDEAFQQMIAEPLGISATYGPVPAEHAAASADSDGYEFGMIARGRPYPVPFSPNQFTGWRDQTLRGVVNDGNTAHSLGGVSGHAGLFSSVDDLLSLGAAVVDGDLVPRAVLERFAAGSSVNPEQALGFRRQRLEVGGRTLTLLHHGGFTGTFFAFALERDLVIAGGAMRLHGTLGSLPSDGAAPAADHIVQSPALHKILLDAARQALADAGSIPAIPGEHR